MVKWPWTLEEGSWIGEMYIVKIKKKTPFSQTVEKEKLILNELCNNNSVFYLFSYSPIIIMVVIYWVLYCARYYTIHKVFHMHLSLICSTTWKVFFPFFRQEKQSSSLNAKWQVQPLFPDLLGYKVESSQSTVEFYIWPNFCKFNCECTTLEPGRGDRREKKRK